MGCGEVWWGGVRWGWSGLRCDEMGWSGVV